MYTRFTAMQNTGSTFADFAEAGGFVCAILLLGSAVMAESVFVCAVSISVLLVQNVFKNTAAQ